MEDVVTDSKGDARLQPLQNGDILAFALNQVDSQNVFVGYYSSGKVRENSLQLQNLIMHQHSWQQVEQSVTLDPQQVPVIRISRSYGGPPDPPAQQCLRELRELKPGMRDSEANELLHNLGFHREILPATSATIPAARGLDISERRDVFLNDHYPRRELHLRLRYDSENSNLSAEHYRLNEWYVENLDTGTRTEDADVLRQAWPGY